MTDKGEPRLFRVTAADLHELRELDRLAPYETAYRVIVTVCMTLGAASAVVCLIFSMVACIIFVVALVVGTVSMIRCNAIIGRRKALFERIRQTGVAR